MKHWYRMIMDPDWNPLNNLLPVQRFQVMVYLSIMWTAIFCAVAGAWAWYGHLLIGHLLIALGLIITAWTFSNARQGKTQRDYPLNDGTARYDDLWGG